MAGISGVGSGSSAIFPLTASGNADADSSDVNFSSGALGVSADDASGGAAATSPLADLRGQIETAVGSALEQLPPGSSPQDVFSAIQGAVQNTLKANGLDPQQILSQGHGHHHHHARGAPAGGGGAAGNDGDADDQQSSNPLTAPGSTSADALVTLLQQITGSADSQGAATGGQPEANGAASQTDPLLSTLESSTGSAAGPTNSLLSALQSSASGGVHVQNIFLQLFQDFPSGTGLDVRA
jgi:hypothetical protein